ncbi:MAG: DUF2163 domain-containing protein [Cyanobacteria bacterium P01_G01_bin.19]
MVKVLDSNLTAALAQEELTLCWCWLITRIDGVQLGFTNLDVAFGIDGVNYVPFSGFDPGASQQSLDPGSVDSQQLKGILDASGISEADLVSGIYQYASVRRFLINYRDIPTSLNLDPPKHIELPPGHTAESKRNSLGYEMKVKDDLEFLSNQILDETSKTCRARVGDDRCRKSLTNFTHNLTITAVQSKRVFSVDGNLPNKWFNHGRLKFTSGANIGLHRDIGFYVNNQIILSPVPAPFEVAVGDAITAIAGCNGTKLTCVTKFENFANFIGEPDLPTTDLSIDTPTK